jgi:hypothetical protein
MVLFNRALFNGFTENIKTFISKDYELKFADEIDLTKPSNQKKMLSRLNNICDTVKCIKKITVSAATRRNRNPQPVVKFKINKEVTIGHAYIKALFEKIIKDNKHEKLDIIYILDNNINSNDNIDKIISFLVTEIGECDTPEYKHIPVLNLISVARRFEYNESGKLINRIVYPGVTRILFYMYLMALMKNGYDYGLLEVADNYKNLAGLCLYNKFGFREDISIKTATCFFDGLYKYENDDYKLNSKGYKKYGANRGLVTLPMKVDISKLTLAKLNDALINGTLIDVGEEMNPLCTGKYKPVKINRNTMTDNEIKKIKDGNLLRKEEQNVLVQKRIGDLMNIKNVGLDFDAKKRKSIEGRHTRTDAMRFLSKQSKKNINITPFLIPPFLKLQSKITKKKKNRRKERLKRVNNERANIIANRRRVSSGRATAKFTSGLSSSRRSKRISSRRATKRKSRSSSNNKSRKRV